MGTVPLSRFVCTVYETRLQKVKENLLDAQPACNISLIFCHIVFFSIAYSMHLLQSRYVLCKIPLEAAIMYLARQCLPIGPCEWVSEWVDSRRWQAAMSVGRKFYARSFWLIKFWKSHTNVVVMEFFFLDSLYLQSKINAFSITTRMARTLYQAQRTACTCTQEKKMIHDLYDCCRM